ncbi:MAG TPA: hypothetical protein VFK25_02050 [Candidatus Binatia bacterium]|nr:hypothetical protein [Candidatus Binatia bacterium]
MIHGLKKPGVCSAKWNISNVSILKAALSLEEQNERLDYDTEAVISLHYLVLALRKKIRGGLYCVSIMFLKL